jgi:Leucine-rich repeat (LRR) protein
MKTKLLLMLLLLMTINTFSQVNLVSNGGFETWTNSTTLSDWTTKNTVIQNTTYFTEGSKSAQLSIANNTTKPEILAQVPMVAGKTYTIKFKYKYVTSNYNGQHPISLNISKNGSATTLSSSTFATNNSWTVKETTFTPDQNLSYDLSISLATFDNEAFDILIDDVKVYEQGTEQYTLIPDTNFEAKLIALNLDDVADGKVLTLNINTLTSLNVSSSFIADLTGIEDFKSLTLLNCSNNSLTNLDLSKNIKLTSVSASKNNLTNVDVSKNLSITYLNFQKNKLANINISNNILLDHFDCSYNNLISINVSKNTLLTNFYCYNNQITSLDVSKNIALDFFMCHFNKLKAIDVSKNTELTIFDCLNNEIKSIDISKNPKIYEIACENNQLTYLNLKNGNNVNFDKQFSNFVNNPSLTCIEVDDVNYSNANWATKKDSQAIYSSNPCPIVLTYTLIPDTNFEAKLIALGIDDVADGKVLTSRISGLTDLNLNNSSITNMTGIEDFASLSTLFCSSNQLTTIDLSKNVALTYIDLGYNKLTNINVSNNIDLEELGLRSNMLTSIDVTKNTKLRGLGCSSNLITSLDLSNNTALVSLNCEMNKLSKLDMTKNIHLIAINCSDNNLTTLDLRNGNNKNTSKITLNFTKNQSLNCILVDDALYCNKNWPDKKDPIAGYSTMDCSLVTAIPDVKFEQKLIDLGIDTDGLNGSVSNTSIGSLTSLNVSSSAIQDLTGIKGFVALTSLVCFDNQISNLDLSQNLHLTSLNCSNNPKLEKLNLKNGNNTAFITATLDFTNNPALVCIMVDDSTYSNTYWTDKKEVFANYNVDCTPYTLIPDLNFEQKLIALGIDKDGINGKVITADINKVTFLDLADSNISDLSGIEDFKELIYFFCDRNKLSSIDVSKNTLLENLGVNENNLTSLDVTKNTKLHTLTITQNKITSIDLLQNINLKRLGVNDNQLTELDLTNITLLTELDFSNNNLTSIDITKQANLSYLNCGFNKLTSLDISQNPKLQTVYADSNQFTELNVQNGNNENLILPSKTNKNSTATVYTSFLNNPKLTCIKVDNVAFSNANWSNIKDASATYNIECTGELTLPSNNFAIETKGESCLGENNGEINITAKQIFSYVASVNGIAKTFTDNSLKLSALTPETYTILITIPGQIFEQTFNIVIAKGATITGKSSITDKKINVEITEGTAPYTVFVNGIEQFETNTSSFSVTAKGGGLLEVKTAKACEGIYAKDIAGLDMVLSAYPNPTSGSFEIELPTSNKEVSIEINTLDGRVISNKIYTLENGTAKLTLENQPKGVYIAKIYLDTIKNVKIIKN